MLSRQLIVVLEVGLILSLAMSSATLCPVYGNGVGSLYVADESSGNVYVVDTVTQTTVAVIGLPEYSHGMAFSPDAKSVYVANTGSDALTVIDTVSEAVAETIDSSGAPLHPVLSPNRRHVYVVGGQSGVAAQIDLEAHKLAQTLPLGGQPHGTALSANGRYLYVANEGTDAVQVVDTIGWRLVSAIPVPGSGPTHIALAPGQDRAFVTATAFGAVVLLNTSTGTAEAMVPTAAKPVGLAVSANGRYVYVVHENQPVLSIIDASTLAVTTVPLPAPGSSVVVSKDGAIAYLASSQAKAVLEVDTAKREVIETIKVPGKPAELALSPIQAASQPQSGPPLTIPAKLPRTGGIPIGALVVVSLAVLHAGRWIRARGC